GVIRYFAYLSHRWVRADSVSDPAVGHATDYGRNPPVAIDCPNFDGDLRNVRILCRPGVHHYPIPAFLCDPRNVVVYRCAGANRCDHVLYLPVGRAQCPEVVPRATRDGKRRLTIVKDV